MIRLGWMVVFSLGMVHAAWAGPWPQWRGPLGTGISDEKKAPLTWSDKENIRWRVPLPGEGNATPIVWGERVFVPCATEGGKKRGLYCFHRHEGKLLWAKEIVYDKPESTHDTNPYCSASPITDGERVVVWYGSAGVFCYDFSGKELWRQSLGEFDQIWGNASSPIFWNDLVILNCGPGVRCFLVALDKKTGAERWRTTPPLAAGKKPEEFRGAWSTPVLHPRGDTTELVVNLPERLVGYDPATGAERWSCRGLSALQYTSPLVNDRLIVAMSGFHGPAMGVKTGGTGDISDSHRLWLSSGKNPQRVGSGVLVGTSAFILQDGGECWRINAETGAKVWEKRLSPSWSSMCYVAGRLYVPAINGTTYVIDPEASECKVLAENRLAETTRASLAFSEGQIFLRTYKALYCIEEAK